MGCTIMLSHNREDITKTCDLNDDSVHEARQIQNNNNNKKSEYVLLLCEDIQKFYLFHFAPFLLRPTFAGYKLNNSNSNFLNVVWNNRKFSVNAAGVGRSVHSSKAQYKLEVKTNQTEIINIVSPTLEYVGFGEATTSATANEWSASTWMRWAKNDDE